jgi:hypothetical protein
MALTTASAVAGVMVLEALDPGGGGRRGSQTRSQNGNSSLEPINTDIQQPRKQAAVATTKSSKKKQQQIQPATKNQQPVPNSRTSTCGGSSLELWRLVHIQHTRLLAVGGAEHASMLLLLLRHLQQ